MSLKYLIKRKELAKACAGNVFVMPGEPMIYSCKSKILGRSHSGQHFRNLKWASLLKCHFPAYMSPKTPVVLFVTFYVSPPDRLDLDPKAAKQELPAMYTHEVCEYLVSFLEMLHRVLFNSYRQIVKVDASKFYSSKPRTEMQFMTWETYAQLQNSPTVDAETQTKRGDGPRKVLQPKRKRDG